MPTPPESTPDLLRRAAAKLAQLDKAATSPWIFWDGVHRDPVLTSDQRRGRLALVAEFSSSPADYGRANVTLAATLRPITGRLAAMLAATADRWDADNTFDRPESGELQPSCPEAWWCGSCQGAIDSPDYPEDDQRCTCGRWTEAVQLARSVLGQTED